MDSHIHDILLKFSNDAKKVLGEMIISITGLVPYLSTTMYSGKE